MTDDIVKRLQSTGSMSQTEVWETIDEAAAEITALRAEVEKWHDGWMTAEGRLVDAEAERDRLREALTVIDALDPEIGIDDLSEAAVRGLVWRMGKIARAALTTKGDADDRA